MSPVLPDIAPSNPVGGNTAQDLLDRTRDLLAEAEQDFYGDAAEIMPALNEGVVNIFTELRALPQAFAETTTVGQATVACPEDVGRWFSLKCDGSELRPITTLEYAELPEQSGTPTHYCPMFVDGAGRPTLLLWPTCTVQHDLSGVYSRIPAKLSVTQGSEQAPTWHERYHFLPCYYAAAVLLHKDNMSQAGDLMMQRFEAGKLDYRHWLARQLPYRETQVESQPVRGL